MLWAILVLLRLNPVSRQMTSTYFIFLLLYGGLILIYDLFKSQKGLNNKYLILLGLFLLFLGISTLVNYNHGLIKNIKTLITMTVELFVISRIDIKKPADVVKKEMKTINRILILGITLAMLFSLALFLGKIRGSYSLAHWEKLDEKIIYFYGVSHGNRLIGIFTNPNSLGAYAGIAILLSIINMRLKSSGVMAKVLYSLSILVNVIAIILSNSRAALLALYLSLLVIVSYGILSLVINKYKRIRGVVFSVLISLFFIYSVNNLLPVMDHQLRQLPSKVEQLNIHYPDFDLGLDAWEAGFTEEDINLSENRLLSALSEDLSSKSSGRLTIWEMGIKTARENLLFGVGKAHLNDAVAKKYEDDASKRPYFGMGMHNIFLETLVAYGLVAVLILLTLLILIFIDFLRRIFYSGKFDLKAMDLGVFALAMLLYGIVRNFFESDILFTVNISSFVFLLYLGYAMYFNQRGSSSKKGILAALSQALAQRITFVRYSKNDA